MTRACIAVAMALIAVGCTPRDAHERAVAECQRRAAGLVAEAECRGHR